MNHLVTRFFLTQIFVTFIVLSQNGVRPVAVAASTDKPNIQQDLRYEKFAPARKILKDANVPFDPDILLSWNWRQKLHPTALQMPEMRSTLRADSKLQGLIIADTLVLPEKVQLTGDLVILADTIVFEGYDTEIRGLGKNIYVFPFKDTFHIKGTFTSAMKEQGYDSRTLPAVNQRTDEIFTFPSRIRGIVSIDVTGQGYYDWLAKYGGSKRRDSPHGLNTPCPPQTPDCHGEPGAEGVEGTPGYSWGHPILPPNSGFHGNCNGSNSSGLSGAPGANGDTGPNNAGPGNTGIVGGEGGTIHYQITALNDDVYVFNSRGGLGGLGGPGGPGAQGDPGQKGGWGGNGADCPCNHGGSGSGADGNTGGRGGAGGRGGRGGTGGPGGPGGDIFVTFPYEFNENHIAAHFEGGYPGLKGRGGTGGNPGNRGDGGDPGKSLGKLYCPSTQGINGNPGIVQQSFDQGSDGDYGDDGTIPGGIGSYHPTRLPPTGGGGGGPECEGGDICENPLWQSEFRVIVPDNLPSCCQVSPIVIDILGDGFAMTDAQNGVQFDFNGDGTSHLMSWTAGSSDDAWLVLDRNGNGAIDSGSELFGNITPQPESPTKNGFLALAEYDKLLNGGNRDGQIDRNDLVFARLRLWQDTNHNGISEPGELHRMNDLGLRAIDLDYSESRRRDEYGNWFRYRSKVRDSQNSQIGRWAWDVFLTVEP
jgi:hypothetical protein